MTNQENPVTFLYTERIPLASAAKLIAESVQAPGDAARTTVMQVVEAESGQIAQSVVQEMLVGASVFITHLHDFSSNHKFVLGYLALGRLVPAAHALHSHFSARKIDLNIQDTFLADQIVFLDSDRRNEE